MPALAHQWRRTQRVKITLHSFHPVQWQSICSCQPCWAYRVCCQGRQGTERVRCTQHNWTQKCCLNSILVRRCPAEERGSHTAAALILLSASSVRPDPGAELRLGARELAAPSRTQRSEEKGQRHCCHDSPSFHSRARPDSGSLCVGSWLLPL